MDGRSTPLGAAADASMARLRPRLPMRLLFAFSLLALALSPAPCAAFSFTTKPPLEPPSGPTPTPNTNPFVRTISKRIYEGQKTLHVRELVTLPFFKGVGSKVVGLVSFGSALYATTSTSGAYIYKVHLPTRTTTLWFRLGEAVVTVSNGTREVNCNNTAHGGLRGVAFPPDFFNTGLFYTSYVETAPPPAQRPRFRYLTQVSPPSRSDSVVVEWRYDFGLGRVQLDSYRVVLRIPVPVFDHPIKQIAFHTGHNLLITHGDASVQSALGGGGMRNDGLGKILRIDPRRQPDGAPYAIPPDNPFAQGQRPKIDAWLADTSAANTRAYPPEAYAVGFRNPHTICVSRADGTIYSTDAGRDNAEEVNLIAAGGNYGWPEREGTFVHTKEDGVGLGEGIAPLPVDDARYGFRYPNAQIGHFGRRGKVFSGHAIAGACPIENGSPLSGTYWFTNFPSDGQMYYLWTGALKKADVAGPPAGINPANVYRGDVVYHRQGKPPLVVKNFAGVVAADGFPNQRADIRFGRGPQGQIFISSKTTSKIYVVINSIPPWLNKNATA